MPQRRSHVAPSAAQTELADALAALRESLEVPTGFPATVETEAAESAPAEPELDLRDIPFATLDPLGSRDLDQAFHLERAGSGFTVRYAIADVPSFVAPGSAVDAEARRRGQTLYAADGTIPLHPRVLSEDHATLLPDVDRPALVWTFSLDTAGAVTDFRLERALIRVALDGQRGHRHCSQARDDRAGPDGARQLQHSVLRHAQTAAMLCATGTSATAERRAHLRERRLSRSGHGRKRRPGIA